MSIPELRPETAHARRASLRVVDVRERHEFEGPLGRIPGAACVPLSTLAQAPLDPAGRWLLVCRSGRRSRSACEMLRARGFADVSNLTGGMIAWNRAGLPIVRTPLPDTVAILRSLVAWLAQVGGGGASIAREQVEGWLAERGEAFEQASIAGVESVLARVEAALRGPDAPDDLELSLAAWRADLAPGR